MVYQYDPRGGRRIRHRFGDPGSLGAGIGRDPQRPASDRRAHDDRRADQDHVLDDVLPLEGERERRVGEDIRPPPSLKVLEPKIIDVDATVAYINVGLIAGLRSGDKYGVWDHGRDLRDPDTGAVLGQAPPRNGNRRHRLRGE